MRSRYSTTLIQDLLQSGLRRLALLRLLNLLVLFYIIHARDLRLSAKEIAESGYSHDHLSRLLVLHVYV